MATNVRDELVKHGVSISTTLGCWSLPSNRRGYFKGSVRFADQQIKAILKEGAISDARLEAKWWAGIKKKGPARHEGEPALVPARDSEHAVCVCCAAAGIAWCVVPAA
jgi:hypothetical protein